MAAQFPPQSQNGDRLRSRALETLRSRTLEAVLEADQPLRTADVARVVAERLPLRLNETELGGFAALERMVLDSDPLYSQANRQWDLAFRMGRAEGDRRKPVERAVEDFIDLLGRPALAAPVAVLVASVYGRTPDYYVGMIDRFATTRPQFFRVGRNRIAVTRWLPDLSSDEPELVEEDNFQDPTLLNVLRQVAEGIEAEDARSYARELILRAGDPVDNRALLFLTWSRFPETSPAQVFNSLYLDPAVALERGPAWVTAAGHSEVLETLRGLARDPESVTELVASSVPAEEEEISFVAPTAIRVSDEDLEGVYEYMRGETRAYRISELCAQALEAFPGSRTYTAISESLQSRIAEDPRFRWVGFDRFRLSGTIPTEAEIRPDGLSFDEGEYLDEEGAEVDRILEPRDWKGGLEAQTLHSLVQDLDDDGTTPLRETPAVLESSPPLHHYVTGTRYLREADRGFFPDSPPLLQATFVPQDGARFDVWVNGRLRLILGLKEWYEANLPWVGGRFTLTRAETAGEYLLVPQPDEPLMAIPEERLARLIQLRNEAQEHTLTLTEIVQRLLRDYPDGVHFVTLFTEVNIVRRVRRAQVASVLTLQKLFTQNPQQPGVWSYDEKRAAKAKRKGPRRPIREYEDDDEELE